MSETKYTVLGRELPLCREHWDKKIFRATYGVLALELTKHCNSGDPWHHWSASILIGGVDFRKTNYVPYIPGDQGSFPRDTMPQTPNEPLRWLRDNAIEVAREMQGLANWEPG